MDEHIDALAREALSYSTSQRRQFLRKACPSEEVLRAVQERIDKLKSSEAEEPPSRATTSSGTGKDQSAAPTRPLPGSDWPTVPYRPDTQPDEADQRSPAPPTVSLVDSNLAPGSVGPGAGRQIKEEKPASGEESTSGEKPTSGEEEAAAPTEPLPGAEWPTVPLEEAPDPPSQSARSPGENAPPGTASDETGSDETDSDRTASDETASDDGQERTETVHPAGNDTTLTQTSAPAGGTVDSPDETDTSANKNDDSAGSGSQVERIGPWRLVDLLGQGGMGAVYLAERADGQFQQQAALKLIRHDLGPEAQQRFLSERQILAQLQHPNIAHLLDGGVTEDGRPYFAMEHVDGTPIDTYCNERGLGVEERLRLFQQVARAVQFAHSNLIVHRDLKPSNILVAEPTTESPGAVSTETGTSSFAGTSAPQVKLLDFGIAKALEGAEGIDSYTKTGEGSPMTPSYAAPEQVQGASITTATDVYAMGVVLCKLLTGALPYDVRGRPPLEVTQIITEAEPTRPSELVKENPDSDVVAACTRSAEALQKRLQGDLDVIVQKALRKEPDRRYTSATDFGQDVDRHLEGLPVEARPATTGYRLRRFVERNQAAVLSAAGAVVALLLGLGVAIWQAQVAAEERDQARSAQAEAEEAITFLTTLFENATPEEAGGDTLTVFDLVDRGRGRLGTLSDQPALQARMFHVVGEVHEELSEYETADSLLQRSVQLYQAQPTPDHERLGKYLTQRAGVQWRLGRPATADSLAQRALQEMRAGEATGAAQYADAISLRANIALSQRELTTADSLLQVAATRYRNAEEDQPSALAGVAHNRASLHYQRGNHARAETLYREALRTYRQTKGPNHPDVLTIHSATGLMLQKQGQFEEAAAHLDTAITRGTRVLGPRHAQMAAYYSNLADVRTGQKRYAAADSLYRLTLMVDTTQRGPEHPYVADDWRSIGTVNQARDRPKQALEAFDRESSIRRSNGPSVDLARALYAQGTALTELGRYATAEDRLLETRTVLKAADETDSVLTADLRSALATVYTERGQPEEAKRWRARLDSLSGETSSPDLP